eukprot:1455048-Amphidinium_carterae.1
MDDVAIGIGRVHVANINLRAELLKYVNARSTSLWKQLWLLSWGAKKRRADDIDAIAASFVPVLITSESLFKRFLWKALLAILAATRRLYKPWDRMKEVIPPAQHKAAWEGVLTAVVFPNKVECQNEKRIMAPPFESLPKKLEKLQEEQKASDSLPAAKKMPSKAKPVAVAGKRTVPPPPPPPVHGGNDARSGDHDRVNLTPRRRPTKRQKTGKSSPQSFSPSMAWS